MIILLISISAIADTYGTVDVKEFSVPLIK